MTFRAIALSVLIHVVVIGGIAALFHAFDEPEPKEHVVFFELVEAASLEQSASDEAPSSSQEEDETSTAEEAPRKEENVQELPEEVQDTVEPRPQQPQVEEAPDAEESVVEVADEISSGDSPLQEEVEAEPSEQTPPPAESESGEQDESDCVDEQPSSASAQSLPSAAPVAEEERATVVSAPSALGRIVPVYPRNARRRGREGSVTIEAEIDRVGGVTFVAVAESSGHGDLDDAACKALSRAKFSPATEDGRSVPGRIRMTFDFRLK